MNTGKSKTKGINKLRVGALWAKVKTLGLLSKLCKFFRKTVIYQSKTGFKEINPYIPKHKSAQSELRIMNACELRLGIDFLKDDVSLIDVPIVQSPHYGLMKDLSEGGDGRSTEYVKRMLNGALDERYELLAFYLDKNYFRRCFERTKHSLETDSCAEVIAYKKNGRYYIHDGKHRAAMCALFSKTIKCRIVDFRAVRDDFNPLKVERIIKSK